MPSKLLIDLSVPLAGENIVDQASELQAVKGPLGDLITKLPKGTEMKMRVAAARPSGHVRKPRVAAAAAAIALALAFAMPAKASIVATGPDPIITGLSTGGHCLQFTIKATGPQLYMIDWSKHTGRTVQATSVILHYLLNRPFSPHFEYNDAKLVTCEEGSGFEAFDFDDGLP